MNNRLGEESINKLLWELSIPAILGMLSGAIFNVVDRIFVGRIDSLALTGVGITMPLQILQMALVLLVGVGSSTLISIKLGEGKKDEAEDILFLSFKYIVIAMVVFAALYMIFQDSLMKLLSVSDQVMPYAKTYINILIIGAIFGIPGYCLNNSLRAIGKASISMKIILFSSLLNMILDPIFIFVLDMGIAGAAIATVISQMVLTIYVVLVFIKGRGFAIHLKLAKVKNEWDLILQILHNGSPSFFVQVLATFVNIFLNWSFLHYGTDLDIASVTIMSTVFSFYHMIVFGIVQGNQPICGYNWGAKKYDRVAASLKLSLFYAFILSVVLFAAIQLFPFVIVRLFTDDPQLITISSKAIRIYLSMLPLVGLQTVSSQYFQSVRKPKLSSILSFLRYGVIVVPSVLILAPVIGVGGIYMSNAISDLVASIIAIGFIIAELKNLSRLHHVSVTAD
ncbi:MAG: MATE family efflux transporter [Proteocatella sp.]